MNAWAIYDRRSELPFRDYTENRPAVPNPARHPFIQLIDQLAANRFDVIFCAGNCGGVCPDGRCGPNDIGPGRGIWGANAHPSALTVGAVRTDNSWIGYSSEGPGPGRAPLNKLAHYKPDLCTPSHYEDSGGDYTPSRGTSAAAALAAGVVAAFRSKASWSQTAVSPAQLIQTLSNNTVERLAGLAWTSSTWQRNPQRARRGGCLASLIRGLPLRVGGPCAQQHRPTAVDRLSSDDRLQASLGRGGCVLPGGHGDLHRAGRGGVEALSVDGCTDPRKSGAECLNWWGDIGRREALAERHVSDCWIGDGVSSGAKRRCGACAA